MDASAHKFFKEILNTPSPSGYESPIQEIVRDYIKEFADEVRSDLHGNLIVVKNPEAPFRVMYAGHCDQIGLIAQHIDDQGFIFVQPIGGWDPQVLIGQRMIAWTEKGPVLGIIGRKPLHLLTDEEKKQVPKIKDLWLDIGASGKEEASKTIRIGDPITVQLKYEEVLNKFAVAPAMDDKAGCWVVMEAFRRVAKGRKKLKCGLYSVSTVQEELGLRGAKTSAYGIDAQVGVAVDVTFSTDCPTIEKKEEGDVSLGKGPTIHRGPNMNPHVVSKLIEAADEHKIPYQLVASGRATGTDANAMQLNRAGMATGLVSIPNRYMHSPVEMISLEDLDHAADLLARFVESIDPKDDFVP